ncbi:hypothetical protein QFC21_000501 [Naganishia friedmannii]|uniref:Uncharacterized protein n=1 Tax=Naganishia friedmannii TaxID=89922 RepID=A0ACC2WF50_9TREE|nr:hypothetical protein QFC21_000501 [Naganishia friedmannii]
MELTQNPVWQITDTLASVRKVNPAKILEELNASGEQDPDASYVNNDVAFANRPLASRVLSTASVLPQTQTLRKVPSLTSNADARGYSLAPEQVTERRRARAVDGIASSSKNVLSGLSGYRQERDRPSSRLTDRTTGSDKGKERDTGERPGSALSSNHPQEHRRLRDGESNARVQEGREDRHHQVPVKSSRAPSDVNPEADQGRTNDKDRFTSSTKMQEDESQDRKRYQPRDQERPKERADDRARGSAPETPVSIDDDSPDQRDTIRQEHLNAHQESEEPRLLDCVPLSVQEAWVCEDLGYALQGIECEVIRYDPSYNRADPIHQLRGVKWTVDPSLDPSLRSVVRRILPMATFYTAINAFVDLRLDRNFGMINHALASGIRDALKDYHILLAKLESLFLTSPTFTLQSALLYLHPTIHPLSLLYSLCLTLAYEVTEVEQEESDDEQDEDEDVSEDEEEKAIRARFGLAAPTGELDARQDDGPGPIIGGEVLGVLLEKEILRSGQLHASQPYAKMLLRWITTGLLHDPYQEFMVKVDDTIEKAALETDFNDDYWERRYTLRDGSSSAIESRTNADRTVPFLQLPATGQPELRPGTDRFPGGACIPPFLEEWKVKILRTGKYLNVIRECGMSVEAANDAVDPLFSPEPQLTISDGLINMEETKFYRTVDHAYMTANQRLLDLMLKEKGLIPYLRSMKHFFFLDQSEFMSQFIDNASSEFKKSVKSVSMVKIQSLLYMAITNPASPTSLDPHKDDLRATMATSGLFEWLGKIVNRQGSDAQEDGTFLGAGDETKQNEKGKKDLLLIEALSIDFDVKFPLSLVISRKAITRYQLVFRFLLNLKYLESLLTSMWMEHRQILWRTRLEAPDMERWKRRIYNLRAQMLQWVQQMLTFTTQDVLEANWKRLEAKLAKVQTVDQLIQDHVDYLDVCLKECMLTTDRLLPPLMKTIGTVLQFAQYQPSLNRTMQKYLADPRAEGEINKVNARWNVLDKFESHFTHNVVTQYDTMSYADDTSISSSATSDNPALSSLVSRLSELKKWADKNLEQAQ